MPAQLKRLNVSQRHYLEAEVEDEEKKEGDGDVDASLFEGDDLDVDDLGNLDELDLGE